MQDDDDEYGKLLKKSNVYYAFITCYLLIYLIPIPTYKVGTVITLILHMKKLIHREDKYLALGHIPSK